MSPNLSILAPLRPRFSAGIPALALSALATPFAHAQAEFQIDSASSSGSHQEGDVLKSICINLPFRTTRVQVGGLTVQGFITELDDGRVYAQATAPRSQAFCSLNVRFRQPRGWYPESIGFSWQLMVAKSPTGRADLSTVVFVDDLPFPPITASTHPGARALTLPGQIANIWSPQNLDFFGSWNPNSVDRNWKHRWCSRTEHKLTARTTGIAWVDSTSDAYSTLMGPELANTLGTYNITFSAWRRCAI